MVPQSSLSPCTHSATLILLILGWEWPERVRCGIDWTFDWDHITADMCLDPPDFEVLWRVLVIFICLCADYIFDRHVEHFFHTEKWAVQIFRTSVVLVLRLDSESLNLTAFVSICKRFSNGK